MKWTHERGFSTIDILSAAALLAVILAMAVPFIRDSMRGYRLASAADQVAAELNAARVLAVSRGTSYRIDFSVARNSFQIVDLSDPDNPTRRERPLGGSMSLVSVPSQPILFSSRGVARGGTVVLANDAGKRVSVEVTASGKTIVHDMESESEPTAY